VDEGEIDTLAALLRVLEPEDRPELRCVLEQSLTDDEQFDIILRGGEKTPLRWIEFYAEAPDATDGTEILCAIRDVTELREQERALERFQQAIEHASHAIYITEADGTIEYVNPEFEELTGYSAEEAIGETPGLLQSDEQPNEYYDRLWRTILEGHVWSEEITDRRKSGELYHADQTIAPILEADDSISGFVALQSDITHRRLRKQELQVLHRILRHNLRNELNIIQGQAENLRREGSAHSVQCILDAAGRLADLTGKAERIERFLHQEAPAEPHQLRNLIEPIIDDFQDEYPDVQFSVDLPIDLIIQSGTVLRIAFRELIQNSITHAERPESEVHITISARDLSPQNVELRIADNGPGLNEMEEIAMSGNIESELEHGSGLGLWMVNWLITKFGGSVTVNENEPSGTEFTMKIPKSQDSEIPLIQEE
jgi:PAS domain S-box-containing protein